MYTKEDIEKAKQYLNNEGYGTGSNFTLNMVANLMVDYAAKNCVIPAVSNRRELLIDFCSKVEETLEMYGHLAPNEAYIDEYLKGN